VASFIIVVAIVLLSVLLDFVQESRAQNAVDALREQVALRADVRRDGAETSVPVAQLVPGDIVQLSAGDLGAIFGDFSRGVAFLSRVLLDRIGFPRQHCGELGFDPGGVLTGWHQ
jgi:cation transport ATPase